jgi:hypothetical protein
MTHIQADLYSASVDAYHHGVQVAHQLYVESQKFGVEVNQHLQKGVAYATRVCQEQLEKHWPTVKPYYDEHVVGNYRKKVEPHMEKHVYPMVTRSSKWYKQEFKPRVEQFGKDCERQYGRLIQLFEQQCKTSLKEFRKASRNSDFLKDHPPPKSLLTIWGDSCSHPQESVDLVFQCLLLLLGLVFYRRLWGIAVWVLSWGVTLILIFTPLGLVISRREFFSKNDKSSIATKGPAGVKSNKRGQQPVPDKAPSSNSGLASKSKRNGTTTKKTT